MLDLIISKLISLVLDLVKSPILWNSIHKTLTIVWDFVKECIMPKTPDEINEANKLAGTLIAESSFFGVYLLLLFLAAAFLTWLVPFQSHKMYFENWLAIASLYVGLIAMIIITIERLKLAFKIKRGNRLIVVQCNS